jgi:cytochrome b561
MNEMPLRYKRTAIWLHWMAALLMIFMLFWGEELMEVRPGQSLAGWEPSAHASFGVLILLLTVARLLWRATNPPPELPQTISRIERMVSQTTHAAFYLLMIAIPLLGLLALMPYGADRIDVEQVTFFKLFSLDFMPNAGGWTRGAHEIASNIAKILVVLHVLSALKHQFWNRDGLLWRMSPRR